MNHGGKMPTNIKILARYNISTISKKSVTWTLDSMTQNLWKQASILQDLEPEKKNSIRMSNIYDRYVISWTLNFSLNFPRLWIGYLHAQIVFISLSKYKSYISCGLATGN